MRPTGTDRPGSSRTETTTPGRDGARASKHAETAAPERHGLAQRLVRLSLGAAALALLVAGAALNLAVHVIERHTLAKESTAQAEVVATHLSAALQFQDRDAARETLDSLDHTLWVAHATLYDRRGSVFAQFVRPGHVDPQPLPRLAAGLHPAEDGLLVAVPVGGSAGEVGRLVLEMPLRPLYRKAAELAGLTAASAAMALLLAWGLAVGVRRDVARVERRMHALAYVDAVTGLFNRHAAGEHLQDYLREAEAAGQGFSIVTFDLDDFKTLNDTLGHAVGDQVLREVANRLREVMTPKARGYRFGGDEFVIICPSPEGLREPQRYGHMVRLALAGSLQAQGYEVPLAGSIGVARWPADGRDPADVLRASDIAMYQAKHGGKNSLVVFDAGLREASEQRLRIESDLRIALREGQLRLHYQPIVELAGGAIVGAEALVRWQHPERGLLGPLEFIDAAERTGLVVPLGGWVLAEAARQLAAWRAQGFGGLRVAVNVSAGQLRGGRLLEQYRDALAAAGVADGDAGLEIELTEHTLVEDVDDNLRLLEALRAMGVRIAIDDFGTGLSSLAYLKRLPIDKLKIDRSFVAGVTDARGDRAIVAAALSIAQALDLAVVAEGVETEAQRDALRAQGCRLAQGWLFGRPVPPEAFAARLRESAPVAIPRSSVRTA